MTEYTKPLPTLSDENRPFWEAAKRRELSMQQCTDCNHVRYPINHVCPRCLSLNTKWVVLSGRGEVFSYVVFHQVYNQAYAQDVPYNVAIVQLEEGPRMVSNVVGVPHDQVKVGDKIEVTFEDVTNDITLPKFRLAPSRRSV